MFPRDGRGVPHGMWCSPACTTDVQAGLEPAAVTAARWLSWWQEMAPDFLSVTWHGEAFHGLGFRMLKV
jgi:hypothetical protein